jgi:hypothetical protein
MSLETEPTKIEHLQESTIIEEPTKIEEKNSKKRPLEEESEQTPKKKSRKEKPKKYALLIGYVGTDYQGIQM